jgi:hypothetical protein
VFPLNFKEVKASKLSKKKRKKVERLGLGWLEYVENDQRELKMKM